MPIYLFAFVCTIQFSTNKANCQSKKLHDALNPYVEFANEGMHILWAVHLRLEAYNAQSNIYLAGNREEALQFRIDDIIRNYSYYGSLQGVCLRAYGVTDPSVNLEYLYDETQVRELAIPSAHRTKLNDSRDQLWTSVRELLNYCQELTDYTQSQAYLNDEKLSRSYDILEQCEELYDKYQQDKDQLAAHILAIASPLPKALYDLNLVMEHARTLLQDVRKQNHGQLRVNLNRLEQTLVDAQLNKQARLDALSAIGLYYDRGTTVYKHIISYGNQLVRWSKLYLNQGPVSPLYQAYGRNYYYYNERLLSLYNHHKYGLVAYYNQFLGFANAPLIQQIEETPLYRMLPPSNPIASKELSVKESMAAATPSLGNVASNHLIFLLDVSASMKKPEKLPLLKQAIAYTLSAMREEDKVSIITYSGDARVVLPATQATQYDQIMQAVDKLGSAGETHFHRGLKAAYALAEEEYIIHGNNRIILATDGDFVFKQNALRLAEKQSEKPIFLSVMLFSKFETLLVREQFTRLALAGNGNYVHAQEDNARQALLEEAKAVRRW
ncbi:MAG: VWA domain-containing protein [Bacteroidota bacterium]